MNDLFEKLGKNNLLDGDNIILERYEGGNTQTVNKDIFLVFFGDVSESPTYEALSGNHTFLWGDPPQSLTYNATQLGYQ